MSQSPPAKRARLSSVASDASDLEPRVGSSSVVQPFPRAISTEEQPPAAPTNNKLVNGRPEQEKDLQADKGAEKENSATASTVFDQAGSEGDEEDDGEEEQVTKGGAAGGAAERAPIENRPTPARSPTPEPEPRKKARIEREKRIDDLTREIWRSFEALNKEGVAIAAWIVDPKRERNPSARASLNASIRDERSSVSTCSSSASETIPDVNFNSYISNTVRSIDGLNSFTDSKIPATFSTGSKRFESVFDAAAKSLRKTEVSVRIYERRGSTRVLQDNRKKLEKEEKNNEERKAATLKKIEEERRKIEEEWEMERRRIAGRKSNIERAIQELQEEARVDGRDLDAEYGQGDESE